MRTFADQMIHAFYGGKAPPSQRAFIEREIMNIFNTIQSDLRGEIRGLSEIDSDTQRRILESATLSVFQHMHALRALKPTDYTKDSVGVPSFQKGVAKAHELLADAEQKRNVLEAAENLAHRQPIREKVQNLFDTYHHQAQTTGHPEPKVTAWEALIDQHIDLLDESNFVYYLLCWSLPMKQGIYNHPRIIEVCQKHPRLMNRKGPSFASTAGKDALFQPK